MSTMLAPRVEKIVARLERTDPPPPLKTQLHQLHVALNALREQAELESQYRLEHARELQEYYKRALFNPTHVARLQVTAHKTGREHTRQLERENAKRKEAIESGRIKKQTKKRRK